MSRRMSAPDEVPAPVQQALALLAHSQALISITFQVDIAGTEWEITVRKPVDRSGKVLPGFQWEVDQLAGEAPGRRHREDQAANPRSYDTAKAAYAEAVAWVQAHSQS